MTAIPRPRRATDRKYRTWVKTKGCWATMLMIFDIDRFTRRTFAETDPCSGPIDACHIIPKGHGRTGSKVSDYRCIPGCRHHHEWQGQHPNDYRNFYEMLIEELNRAYFSLRHTEKTPKERPTLTRKQVRIESLEKQHAKLMRAATKIRNQIELMRRGA